MCSWCHLPTRDVNESERDESEPVFSYKLRYIVGFWLVEMAISTNQKPTIYRNLYENMDPELDNLKEEWFSKKKYVIRSWHFILV